MKITHVSPERVTAELTVREELNNRFGIMHGGALMALADNLGGTATTANLQAGPVDHHDREQDQFLRRASRSATSAYAECTPLHRGRTTMVWQTRVTRGDGRLCALVTQTQLVLGAIDLVAGVPAAGGQLRAQRGMGGLVPHAGLCGSRSPIGIVSTRVPVLARAAM